MRVRAMSKRISTEQLREGVLSVCCDVLRAISVASKLLIEQIELITDEVITLANLVER